MNNRHWTDYVNARPIIIAVAGPDGSGKTTFFEAHLKAGGLPFINADMLARDLGLGPYEAAQVAAAIRDELVQQGESFIFETVFSDPVGDKIAFLKNAVQMGFHVVLCFIGLNSAKTSDERVAMRVLQGGHNVPNSKLIARHPRILNNLKSALRELPCVLVFDNEDLRNPFKHVLTTFDYAIVESAKTLPAWLKPFLR